MTSIKKDRNDNRCYNFQFKGHNIYYDLFSLGY